MHHACKPHSANTAQPPRAPLNGSRCPSGHCGTLVDGHGALLPKFPCTLAYSIGLWIMWLFLKAPAGLVEACIQTFEHARPIHPACVPPGHTAACMPWDSVLPGVSKCVVAAKGLSEAYLKPCPSGRGQTASSRWHYENTVDR